MSDDGLFLLVGLVAVWWLLRSGAAPRLAQPQQNGVSFAANFGGGSVGGSGNGIYFDFTNGHGGF